MSGMVIKSIWAKRLVFQSTHVQSQKHAQCHGFVVKVVGLWQRLIKLIQSIFGCQSVIRLKPVTALFLPLTKGVIPFFQVEIRNVSKFI